MDKFEAKILFRNLLKRLEPADTKGIWQLKGATTDDEIQAMQLALSLLEEPDFDTSKSPDPSANTDQIDPSSDSTNEVDTAAKQPLQVFGPEINLSVFELAEPPTDCRFCLDFGTAMSKCTVISGNVDEMENVQVLRLGIPGDQEEDSEFMLISSVFIDKDGMIWFGKKAIEHSLHEGNDGSRNRLDNIKRRLTEFGIGENVTGSYNPTETVCTYEEMVLAYLTFLTWTANECLPDISLPRNILRRFGMPSLAGEKSREVLGKMRMLLGEAQILADSFGESLTLGVPLRDFVETAERVRKMKLEYTFIDEAISEPIGVASSLPSWKSEIEMLALVVDIGAGTSDFGMFKAIFDSNSDEKGSAIEVANSSKSLPEAGNNLDKILTELILKEANVTAEHPHWINIRGALELSIREYKETLFNEGSVVVSLLYENDVEIHRQDFLALNAVKMFEQSIRETVQNILEGIDSSWIDWIGSLPESKSDGAPKPPRKLLLVLTGGGARLQFIENLLEEPIHVRGKFIEVVRASKTPMWLAKEYPELEEDYPRIAVSLGGARRILFNNKGFASSTASDSGPRYLGGHYQKGDDNSGGSPL